MDIKELKEILKKFDINQIKSTKHGFKRIQDKKRKISYPLLVQRLSNLKGLYRFEEQEGC